ncbi:MAG: glycosyltransferase family 39 protein, partial [Bryobacterales bacterium]|nr:glycosyltransferase family 39 protein [Bryobacterales bacterium]
NIARRVLDSRTPGIEQIGTVWLPLPHVLMMPFVRQDALWSNGLAGAIPISACYWLGTFLFYLAFQRLFRDSSAAVAGAGAIALNPNLLYLQATPMTEGLFLAAIGGILYGCVRFSESPRAVWCIFTAVFAFAAAMTRYDGWFLLPFVALFLFWKGKKKRWVYTLIFCILAGSGPLWWLGHNWWFWGDALEFYRGPYSAKAIYARQLAAGMAPYPADGNWMETVRYYLKAASLVSGWPFAAIGIVGILASLARGPRWALFLLLLPAFFYIWSMHHGGTPIFVPDLWPNAYYNTRYGLAVLPALGFAVAALTVVAHASWRPWVALAAVVAVSLPWLMSPSPESWVCWKEAEINSRSRREWVAQTGDYLKKTYVPGDGILLSFGDLSGVLEFAGIPLRETLHEGNHPLFEGATMKPRFFLHEEWALCQAGDEVARAMVRAARAGVPVAIERQIRVKNSKPVEVWKRQSDFALTDLSRPRRLPGALAGLDLPGSTTSKANGNTEAEDTVSEEETDADTIR